MTQARTLPGSQRWPRMTYAEYLRAADIPEHSEWVDGEVQEAIDRGDKFYEYEAGGVAEYWLIDPIREVADFFVRDERGTFRASPERPFASTILGGLKVDPGWLWERRDVTGWISEQGLEPA